MTTYALLTLFKITKYNYSELIGQLSENHNYFGDVGIDDTFVERVEAILKTRR